MKSRLDIAHTWDGVALAQGEHVLVDVAVDARGLTIIVDAPFAGDPMPAGAPGRTDRLWEHEVVEVFLAEAATRRARYLEIELGPHGHWLALGFAGYRARAVEHIAVDFAARVDGLRWSGEARVAGSELARVIAHIGAANAYAIRGAGSGRRFFAAAAVPAGVYAGPDFHRLEHFAAVSS